MQHVISSIRIYIRLLFPGMFSQINNLISDLYSRPTEEPQTWASYLGKALMTPSNFLPAQVTEVLSQERAFSTIKLSHGGMKS